MKKLVAFLCVTTISVMSPIGSWAAISIDTHASFGMFTSPSGGGSYTVSGSNPFLFCFDTAASCSVVTAVTYGALPMTAIDSVAYPGDICVNTWYYDNPPAGTATVTFTTLGNAYANCISYDGVDTTTGYVQKASGSTAGGQVTPLALSLTIMNANAWIVYAAANQFSAGFLTPAGGTQRETNTYSAGGDIGPVSAGSNTVDIYTSQYGDSNQLMGTIIELKPAGGAVAPSASTLPLMGI